MKKLLLSMAVLLTPTMVFAERIAIKAEDCGPLAREDLGVVFYVVNEGKRKTYFAKGNAQDICPKLMKSKTVSGYEIDLCQKDTQISEQECATIKEFVIQSYRNE
jgi:hypothetical protein